jgi:hypothetical protein
MRREAAEGRADAGRRCTARTTRRRRAAAPVANGVARPPALAPPPATYAPTPKGDRAKDAATWPGGDAPPRGFVLPPPQARTAPLVSHRDGEGGVRTSAGRRPEGPTMGRFPVSGNTRWSSASWWCPRASAGAAGRAAAGAAGGAVPRHGGQGRGEGARQMAKPGGQGPQGSRRRSCRRMLRSM